ncbi:MAG: serine hydrolase [Azospirillaceae bacterium]|nr:serine hydrolase [Azospirillaceae bacterium]
MLGAAALLVASGVGAQEAGRAVTPQARAPGQVAAVADAALATAILDSVALDKAAAGTDAFLRAQMEQSHIPGLQAAVVWHGRIVFARAYGVANLQTPVPVTAETIMAVNSITKAFTGVAAVRQAMAGALDLEAPVGRYLDDLPEAWRAIPIRQLLSHMSGLPDINAAPGARAAETTQDAVWAWVRAQPVKFPPGERFDYCQTNYALVQRVLDKLAGLPPDTPVTPPLFQLAGMAHTGFGDSTMVTPGKAAGYVYAKGDEGARVLRPVYEIFRPLHRASSGMDSTAEDMARWMIAVTDGRLLDAAGRQTLWTPMAFNDGHPGQWAMGWEVLDRGHGHRAVGMTGGGRAAFFLYPEDDLGVVILTNLSGAVPEDMIDQVAALYGARLGGMAALRVAVQRQGYDQAATIAAGLAQADPDFRPAEAELNDWGYRLLSNGQSRDALAILKLAADRFPDSGNAQDSLGEALAATGDKPGAIAAYERSLALDPKNRNAERRLEKLRAGG